MTLRSKKVDALLARLPHVEGELGSPEILSDQKKYKELSREYKYLSSIKEVNDLLTQSEKNLSDAEELLHLETDPELISLIREEIKTLSELIPKKEKELESILVPPDPDDDRSCIIEVRAGTGGDEAALFVGDTVRMYRNFASAKGWTFEELSAAETERGGYKEYQFVLAGSGVYRMMKHEAGGHRVQRVPETETQGRVHTSAITVAVLLEPDEDHDIYIEEKDLRIDTYRSAGAGGQHVNTTDSAVRITHLPTGIVVTCQDERSQIKNREKAMRILKAKVLDERKRRQEEELSRMRMEQMGTGDRSDRVRTYNFSQNRVTDHRIDLTLYQLDRVMEGHLDDLLQPLVTYFYQKKFQ